MPRRQMAAPPVAQATHGFKARAWSPRKPSVATRNDQPMGYKACELGGVLELMTGSPKMLTAVLQDSPERVAFQQQVRDASQFATTH